MAGGKLLALEILLVFLSLFVPLQSYLAEARMGIFTARDMDRAQLLAAGQLILFGPEASAGGQLPGSFLYFLLALPLKLGLGWQGVWEMQFVMMAAGFSVLWLFLRSRFGVFPAYYALFCAVFFDFPILFIAYNPSFLPLFVVIALASLCVAFDDRHRHRGVAWAVYAVCCGLGMQLHMTFSLLLLAGPVIQVFAPLLGLRRLPWTAFAGGILAFGVTMIPYGVWTASVRLGAPIGQPALPFTGNGESIELEEIATYAIKTRSTKPTLNLVSRVLTLLPFEVIVPLLLLGLGAASRKGAPPTGTTDAGDVDLPFARICVRVLAVCAVASFFPYAMALALSPVRYALLPRMTLDFLVCAILASRQVRVRPRVFFPLTMLGLFAFTCAWQVLLMPRWHLPVRPVHLVFPAGVGGVLFLLTRRKDGSGDPFSMAPALPLLLTWAIHSGLLDNATEVMPSARDFEAMSRVILSQTGWTYDDARLRIYYINTRDTITPSWIYRAVEADPADRITSDPGLARVDGYFASLPLKSSGRKRGNTASRRILDEDIPDMLKVGIDQGGILLGVPIPCGALLLVPYMVVDTERLPSSFHNSSEGYSQTGVLPKLPPVPNAQTHRLTFNECPSHDKACDIAVDVQMVPEGADRWLTRVVLSGEPLSQVCDGVNMLWNQRLTRPTLTVLCGGREQRTELAGSLGLHRDKHRSLNQSLLAPYERRFHVDCPGGPQRIAVGYASATAYTMGRSIGELPGREVSKEVETDVPPSP